jgi:hypothetical protein
MAVLEAFRVPTLAFEEDGAGAGPARALEDALVRAHVQARRRAPVPVLAFAGTGCAGAMQRSGAAVMKCMQSAAGSTATRGLRCYVPKAQRACAQSMEAQIAKFRADKMLLVAQSPTRRALHLARSRTFAATTSKAATLRPLAQKLMLRAVARTREIVSRNPGFEEMEREEQAAAEEHFDVSRVFSLPSSAGEDTQLGAWPLCGRLLWQVSWASSCIR